MTNVEAHQRAIAAVDRGRISGIIVDHLGEVIDDQKEVALKKLIAEFRSGKTDAVTLSSGLSAYCALDDLKKKLEANVKAGSRIQQELNDGPPPTNRST